jgi:hypothetical protein
MEAKEGQCQGSRTRGGELQEEAGRGTAQTLWLLSKPQPSSSDGPQGIARAPSLCFGITRGMTLAHGVKKDFLAEPVLEPDFE